MSHYTGRAEYRDAAERALAGVYARRDPATELVGNTLHTDSGQWERTDAGIGAGSDSYFEYLLKSCAAALRWLRGCESRCCRVHPRTPACG